MQVRLLLAAALLLLAGACAHPAPSPGHDDRSGALPGRQAPANAGDPALAGLDMVAGGYARFPSQNFWIDGRPANFPGRWFAQESVDVFAEDRKSVV